jgi:nuclear transcription factor Y gamma
MYVQILYDCETATNQDTQLVQRQAGADADQYAGIWTNVSTSISKRALPFLQTSDEAQINQGLSGTSKQVLATYWMAALRNIEDADHNYKDHHLPLARIKKVMKADPEVKMISAEAPILFAKGCDVFITELTMRAWLHAEENKRRTLQRSDIAAALGKSDMFDFLIDIVPRDEATPSAASKRSAAQSTSHNVPPPMPPQAQMPPQPQHHHEYYMAGDPHGGYPPPNMYAPDPAGYVHPGAMFEHNQNMYAGYGMQPHQVRF